MNIPTKPLALIIEDNDSLTDIFTQALKIAGFEVNAVDDGLKAIDLLAELTPPLVILDLYLPGVSGDRILAYIRGEERLKESIVVLTTFDSVLADKLREQCDHLLLKPVSFSQLRDLGIQLRLDLDKRALTGA